MRLLAILIVTLLAGCDQCALCYSTLHLYRSSKVDLLSEELEQRGVVHSRSGRDIRYRPWDQSEVDAALEHVLTLPDEWRNFIVEDRSQRQKLLRILRTAGVPYESVKVTGGSEIIYFLAETESKFDRILKEYTGVDPNRMMVTVTSSENLRSLEMVLKEKGIDYQLTEHRLGYQVSWSIRDRALANEIFNFALKLEGIPPRLSQGDDA